MRPHKIVLTVTNDLDFDQRMHRICQALHNAGHEVLLIGRILSISRPLKERRYGQERLKCLFNKGPLFYIEFNLRLALRLLRSEADMICSVDLDTLPAGWLASRHGHRYLVYDAHEYFPESPELDGRRFKRWLWYRAEAFLVPRVDAAYTVSQAICDLFRSRYGKVFGLVRNLPLFWENQPENTTAPGRETPRYMIYQGALNAGRGLEQLIKVVPRTGLELWLAGEGDLSLQLRELASRTAAGKVRFLGRLHPDELRKITASAVLGLNLLEPIGLSYRYSLSNRFFDYIMAEIPQVSIDFPEYKIVNKSHEVALLIGDLEDDTLINSIGRLAGDNALRDGMIENCRRAKRIYNWENERGNLLKIYEELG